MSVIEQSKTRQVYLVLRDRISNGDWVPGTMIPGETTLAAEHGVSRVTVRRAMATLQDEGLVERRRGAGTYVADKGERPPLVADFSDALAHLLAMGRETELKLLTFGYVTPASTLAEALRLPAGERVQRATRVRFIDGEPFSYLITHVPERIGETYSEGELASRPLLALLERSGVKVERAIQDIGAVLATPEIAAALGVGTGAALLSLTRTVYDRQGRGVEHLQALYRPDRYTFRMSLERIGAAGGRRWRAASARTEGAA